MKEFKIQKIKTLEFAKLRKESLCQEYFSTRVFFIEMIELKEFANLTVL